jgi:hypothetical protein
MLTSIGTGLGCGGPSILPYPYPRTIGDGGVHVLVLVNHGISGLRRRFRSPFGCGLGSYGLW